MVTTQSMRDRKEHHVRGTHRRAARPPGQCSRLRSRDLRRERGRTGLLQRPVLHDHPLLLQPLLLSSGASASTVPSRPRLHPWCRLVRNGGRHLLELGGTVVTLEGRAVEQLVPKLLPLLDGTRTVAELAEELGPPVAPAIERALALLAENRLLVEGGDGGHSIRALTATAAFAVAV